MVVRCSCFGHRNVFITKELYEQANHIFEYANSKKKRIFNLKDGNC